MDNNIFGLLVQQEINSEEVAEYRNKYDATWRTMLELLSDLPLSHFSQSALKVAKAYWIDHSLASEDVDVEANKISSEIIAIKDNEKESRENFSELNLVMTPFHLEEAEERNSNCTSEETIDEITELFIERYNTYVADR